MHKSISPSVLSDQILALPKPGEGKRGTDGHIGYLLRQAAAGLRLKMERSLADLDVTPPQFSVLTMIVAYPGVSNADLARLTYLTPQTVSVIVANLERAGFLTRTPHAVHGRIQHLAATDNGLARLKACKARVDALEADVTAGLAPGEEQLVRRWLASIATGT